jgi:hypothetical protein
MMDSRIEERTDQMTEHEWLDMGVRMRAKRDLLQEIASRHETISDWIRDDPESYEDAMESLLIRHLVPTWKGRAHNRCIPAGREERRRSFFSIASMFDGWASFRSADSFLMRLAHDEFGDEIMAVSGWDPVGPAKSRGSWRNVRERQRLGVKKRKNLVAKLIRRLGGAQRVAMRLSAMGAAVGTNTVSRWSTRGDMKLRWLALLQEIAVEEGCPMTMEEILEISRDAGRDRLAGEDGAEVDAEAAPDAMDMERVA